MSNNESTCVWFSARLSETKIEWNEHTLEPTSMSTKPTRLIGESKRRSEMKSCWNFQYLQWLTFFLYTLPRCDDDIIRKFLPTLQLFNISTRLPISELERWRMKLFALSSSARLCVVPWTSIKIYRPPNTESSETSLRYKWKWNSHRIDFQPEKAFWLHDDFMEIYPFLQSVGCQL